MKQVNEIIYSAVKNQSILFLTPENKKLETLFSSIEYLIVKSSETCITFLSNYLNDLSLDI
jgi:hypothetical protein